MKHLVFAFSVITALLAVPAASIAQQDDIRALFTVDVAKAGCCKVRKSASQPWAKKDIEFSKCKKRNKKKDGDKIYQSTGLVWWDRAC